MFYGGGGIRPLARDEGAEEDRSDPIVGTRPKVWTTVKNGRSSAKDGVPERLRCETIQKEVSKILQLMSAGAARRILFPLYPACCDRGSKVERVHNGRDGKELVPLRKPKEFGIRESCEKDFISK